MTAQEASELTKGSLKQKGLLFKIKLAWICGRINKGIEKAAETGGTYIIVDFKSENRKKKYGPIVVKLYRDLGYTIIDGEYAPYYPVNKKMEIAW